MVAKPEKKKKNSEENQKKRTPNDLIIEMLTRIEAAQHAHQEKLARLSSMLQSSGTVGGSTIRFFCERFKVFPGQGFDKGLHG